MMQLFMTCSVMVFLPVYLSFCTVANDKQEEQSGLPEIVEVVEYHDNGALSIKGTTIDGKRSGKWESFYPNGLKWSETSFRDGRKEGPTVTYFENGAMRYNGFYHDDERTGLWQIYDSTGALLARIDKDVDPSLGDSLINLTISGK